MWMVRGGIRDGRVGYPVGEKDCGGDSPASLLL